MNHDQDDDFSIQVIVEPPEQKTELGGANKYYVYHVHGQDKFAEFSVYRRYSDFITLKNCMAERWPGIYLPALPQKKFIGNNHSFFIDTRKRGLQEFLSLIASVKYLWYGDEFQLFMKNNISDVEKSLGNLGKTNNREISTKYENIFRDILSEEITTQQQSANATKLQQFKAYLKNAHLVLEKVSKVSEQMAQARRKFNQKYNHILETFLPDLQDKCLGPLTQNKDSLWFFNSKHNDLADSVKSLKKLQDRNSLHIANELIKEQIREIENFSGILKHKEDYQIIRHKAMSKVKDLELEQTKINAGKQSIMSKIKSMNKEQQLKQNQIHLNKAKEEYKDAEQICKVIDYVLAGNQIQRFKEIRKNSYYRTLKELAKAQKQTFEMEQQIWSRIASEEGESAQKNMYKFYEEKREEKIGKRSSEPNDGPTEKEQQKLEEREKKMETANKEEETQKREEDEQQSSSEKNEEPAHNELNEEEDPAENVEPNIEQNKGEEDGSQKNNENDE